MYVYVYGSSCSTGRKFIKFDHVSHTLVSFNDSTKHQPTSTKHQQATSSQPYKPCLTRVHWSPLEGGTWELTPTQQQLPLRYTRFRVDPCLSHSTSWAPQTLWSCLDRFDGGEQRLPTDSFWKIVEVETYGSLKIIVFFSILRLLKLVMFFCVFISCWTAFFWFRLRTLRSWPLKLFDIRHIFYQPIQKHTGSVEDYYKKCLQLFSGIANYRNTRCS